MFYDSRNEIFDPAERPEMVGSVQWQSGVTEDSQSILSVPRVARVVIYRGVTSMMYLVE